MVYDIRMTHALLIALLFVACEILDGTVERALIHVLMLVTICFGWSRIIPWLDRKYGPKP